jgi:hypothetical protein
MDQTVQMSRAGQNEYASICEKNGILVCRFAKGLQMDLEVAKACVKLRIDFSGERNYPLLVDMRELTSSTRDAREYMASEGSRLVTAGALVVSSPLTRAIGNIFLMLNRPPVPTRLFNSEASAEAWLKEFIRTEKAA